MEEQEWKRRWRSGTTCGDVVLHPVPPELKLAKTWNHPLKLTFYRANHNAPELSPHIKVLSTPTLIYTSHNLSFSSLSSHHGRYRLPPRSDPPCFSWSAVEPPVMQLHDRAEKLKKSREAAENPVTAALITRAQAFVLSAEKRASQGKRESVCV